MALRNLLTSPFFRRQTYSLIFLWVLTWFSYWILMKGQENVINISGAVISAALILASYFVPFPSRFLKVASKVSPPAVSPSAPKYSVMQTTNTITDAKTSACSAKSSSSSAFEKSNQQKNEKEKTRQMHMKALLTEGTKPQPAQTQMATQPSVPLLENKPQSAEELKVSSMSNGCPKNLEYYTMKPRPKSPPEECLVCENLIKCVCLTSN